MEDINVGQKILEYRKVKNLNIRELSELTNVTPSMLSQIERGLANPSINTLKVIAKALEVPIYTFFITSTNTKDLVVRANERKKMTFPDSKDFTYELLSPDLSGSIEFMLMTLTHGSHSSEEPMSHEGEEVAFVLKGKIELYMDSEVIVLNKGDSVRLTPLMKHRWNNPFDEEANVIFAVTPPSF